MPFPANLTALVVETPSNMILGECAISAWRSVAGMHCEVTSSVGDRCLLRSFRSATPQQKYAFSSDWEAKHVMSTCFFQGEGPRLET